MAKIIITFQSPFMHKDIFQVVPFVDGLTQSLIEHGNNVMHIVTSDFVVQSFAGENKPYHSSIKEKIFEKIKKYNPDLIISLNNSSISGIEKIVNCPIALWNADNVAAFSQREKIKSNLDRYIFFSFSDSGFLDYQENLGVQEKQIFKVPMATSIQNKSLEKAYDVSFIGSPFFNHHSILYYCRKYKNKYPSILYGIGNSEKEKMFKKNQDDDFLLDTINSSYDRILPILILMNDGLKIFGPSSWLLLDKIHAGIHNAYDSSLVFSSAHNECIYNKSLMSLSVNHKQNNSSYSWRVPDILASDAVLICPPTKELLEDFQSINLQTFDSYGQLEDVVKKIKSDASYRKDIVLQQNSAIEAGFRWHHRLPIMEEASGVKLNNKPTKPATVERLTIENSTNFLNRNKEESLSLIDSLIFSDRMYKTYFYIYSKYKKTKDFFLKARQKQALFFGKKLSTLYFKFNYIKTMRETGNRKEYDVKK